MVFKNVSKGSLKLGDVITFEDGSADYEVAMDGRWFALKKIRSNAGYDIGVYSNLRDTLQYLEDNLRDDISFVYVRVNSGDKDIVEVNGVQYIKKNVGEFGECLVPYVHKYGVFKDAKPGDRFFFKKDTSDWCEIVILPDYFNDANETYALIGKNHVGGKGTLQNWWGVKAATIEGLCEEIMKHLGREGLSLFSKFN